MSSITCNKCQYKLEEVDRVGFRDTCDKCGEDLHVCLNCKFFDQSSYNECREPQAERVLDKDRANRCDYFEANQGSMTLNKTGSSKDDYKKSLDDLFKK